MKLEDRSEKNNTPTNTGGNFNNVPVTAEEQKLLEEYRAKQLSYRTNNLSVEPQTQSVESADQTPHKSPEKKKLLAIGGGALAIMMAIAITIGVGATKKPSETVNPTPGNTSPVPSESVNPSEQPTATISESIGEPEFISWYELDWSKQSPELQRLNNLSLESFRKEPRDSQLLYYSFLNHIYFDNFVNGKDGFYEGMSYSTKETSSLEDSAEEIINQIKNKMLVQDWSKNEAGKFDSVQCRKLMSSFVDDINQAINPNDNILRIIEVDDTLYGKVREGQEFSKILIRDGLTQTGKDKSEVKYYEDGTPYVTLVQIDRNGEDSPMTLIFVTFTNYAGEKQSIWLEK